MTMSDAGLHERDAQQLAKEYLQEQLNSAYHPAKGFYGNGCWHFLIRYSTERNKNDANEEGRGIKNGSSPKYMGTGMRLVVDEQAGRVIPLSTEQLHDLREVPFVRLAEEHGEIARTEDGYVLRYQARLAATSYLREHFSMYYSAINGLFVPLETPVWQFPISFHMARVGRIEPLGLIDVDARTTGVISLSDSQQKQIRMRVDAIIQHSELATAA